MSEEAAAAADGGEAAAAASAAADGAAAAAADGQSLEFQDGSANGADAGQGGDGGDLILGRFKDRAELEASWKEQQNVIAGRVKEMPDDALRAAAEERGLLPSAPESYDFNAAAEGVEWKSRDEAPEEFDRITNTLREANFTQDQLNAVMPLVQSIVQNAVLEFGAQVDTKAEKGKLSEDWGGETDTRGRAVRDWATANFPSEIFFKPLGATAEGIKFLEQVMKGEKGQQPILNNGRAGFDPAKLDKDLETLRGSEAYQNAHHPEHSEVHQRYDKLLEQKLSAR